MLLRRVKDYFWKKPKTRPPRPTARPCVEPLEDRLAPAIYTVTNTANAGAGSLRDCITQANANAGADQIWFNIPGAGVHTISPSAALPAITDGLSILGYTQGAATPNT